MNGVILFWIALGAVGLWWRNTFRISRILYPLSALASLLLALAGFAALGGAAQTLVLPLGENDTWEWELQAVFVHRTILTEVPDAHEEF